MEALKKSDFKMKCIKGDPFFFGPPMFGPTVLDTSSMTLDEAWEYGEWKSYIKKNEQPTWHKETKDKETEFVREIIKEDKEWVKARRLDYLRSELERIKPEIKEYSSRIGVSDNEYISEAIFATYLQPLLRKKKSLEFEIYSWDHPNTSGKINKIDIERAKEFPIQDILGEPDRRGGNKLFYKSPFRQEKTASFCVYLDSNTYHDFGSPDENGDVISLIMRMRDIEFLEAVKFILHK